MRYYIIIIILVCIGLVGLYFNRMYARIYTHMGQENLAHVYEKTPHDTLVGSRALESDQVSVLRYTALGDSLTAGVGTRAMQETYPFILARHMTENGYDVMLNNLGIPGATTQDVLDQELDQAIGTNPDVVTLLIGTNDMHNYVKLDTFQKNVEAIISALQEKTKAKIILINIPYLEQSTLFSFPYPCYFNKRIQKYNDVLKNVAEEYSLTYVDLYTHTVENKPTYASDLFHPSYEGYEDWANFFYAHTRF